MKRILISILTIAVAAITMVATALQPSRAISLVTGNDMEREKMVPTIRDVDAGEESVTIVYHIENIILEPDSLFPGVYLLTLEPYTLSGSPIPTGRATGYLLIR